MIIRPVCSGDAAVLATIYAHHVIHGTASYETVPPDAAEMERRIARVVSAGWPWLIAEGDRGVVPGYAYATVPLIASFARTASTSVTIAAERGWARLCWPR